MIITGIIMIDDDSHLSFKLITALFLHLFSLPLYILSMLDSWAESWAESETRELQSYLLLLTPSNFFVEFKFEFEFESKFEFVIPFVSASLYIVIQ